MTRGASIECSHVVLVFCSKGYFQSKNCMREIISCVVKGKPIIAVTDPELAKGGLTLEQVPTQCGAQFGAQFRRRV